jgi:hypothetical protein
MFLPPNRCPAYLNSFQCYITQADLERYRMGIFERSFGVKSGSLDATAPVRDQVPTQKPSSVATSPIVISQWRDKIHTHDEISGSDEPLVDTLISTKAIGGINSFCNAEIIQAELAAKCPPPSIYDPGWEPVDLSALSHSLQRNEQLPRVDAIMNPSTSTPRASVTAKVVVSTKLRARVKAKADSEGSADSRAKGKRRMSRVASDLGSAWEDYNHFQNGSAY